MTDYRGLTISNLGGQSSLSDLSIELPTPAIAVPMNFPENQRYRGFSDQSNTQVSDVAITSPPAAPIYAVGIDSVNNGTQIANSTVSLGSGGTNYPSYGLDETNVNPVNTTITGTTISADQPLRDGNADPGAELIVDRSTLQARQIGIAVTPATAVLTNTLIDLGANPTAVAFDVGFENQNSATDSAVFGDGLTIVGSGNDQLGLSVHAVEDNTDPLFVDTATANLLDTVIDLRGANPVAVNRSDDADGTANVNFDYSSLDSTTISESDGAATAPGATTLGAHNLTPQPDSGFGDFASGVYRLAAGSALIDAGGPATQYGALDHDGNSRAILGKPGCTARRDIGAYEFAPAPAIVPSGCPAPTPTPPPTTSPSATTTKKCKKGFKLKKVKGKKKCVKTKKKRA
jgi:hypothetical protein